MQPCGRGVYHKVATPYFFIIMYIVEQYKEDRIMLYMLGSWTCSPEQWFQLSSANTAQTIGEFGILYLSYPYLVLCLLANLFYLGMDL